MMNTKKKLDSIIWACLLFISVSSFFYLFYRQAITTDGLFLSDMKPYIEEVCGINETYDFPYPILFDTAKLINWIIGYPGLAVAITVALYNAIAIIVTKKLLEVHTGEKILSTIVGVLLFFVSMIFIPKVTTRIIGHIYLGVFSPNPWQNGTYMVARPFMILAFYYGTKTINDYEECFKKGIKKENIKPYLLFSLFLLLSTMAKPSYTLVHMITVGVVAIWRFLRQKGRTLKQSLCYALFFIPTIIDLLYQYSGVFTGAGSDGVDRGIAIGLFKVWDIYTPNILLSILLAGAFPIFVLVTHMNRLKEKGAFLFSWQIYLCGFLTSALLYEKGFRMEHFNFAWGYIAGLFIVFYSSVIVMIEDIKNNKNRKVTYAEISLFLLHVVMGFGYYSHLLLGGYYE